MFSDSHGNCSGMRDIMELHDEADIYLHLGDGQRDFEKLRDEYPDKAMRGVRGNCDMGSYGKISDLLVVQGKRLFYTHGHVFNVKHGLDTLLENARGIRADMALFGHTHKAVCDYDNGLHIFNPGSIGYGGLKQTYGIIDITGAGIASHIVEY